MAIELITFVGREASCLIDQHHRNVITNRVGKAIRFANQLLFLAIQMQSAFA